MSVENALSALRRTSQEVTDERLSPKELPESSVLGKIFYKI
jgi:hypothetical protein